MPRYAFGDEAGETGFKFKRGSSRYFVVAIVFVDDPHRLREQIGGLKQDLGMSGRYEFRFSKTSKHFRHAFFVRIQDAAFEAKVLIVDKQKLSNRWYRIDKLSFYVHFVGELILRISPPMWQESFLILDRFGQPRATVRHLKRYVRERSLCVPHRITAKRSEAEPLIQLADMVAGAVFRSGSTGDSTYVDYIATRIESWEYFEEENPPG